jgi:hypothetical protein
VCHEALRVQGHRYRQAVEHRLNELGQQGWQVVGVTTKKQLLIAPPQAIILMREMQTSEHAHESVSLMHASA